MQKLTTKNHKGFLFSILRSVMKSPFWTPASASVTNLKQIIFGMATSLSLLTMTAGTAFAAINIPFTINLSEVVIVTGTPRIAVDVGGNQRFANYTSGTGTNALTFTLSPAIGDIDLDGVTLSSPIDLNGGTIKDAIGNDATLTFIPPNTAGIKINYPSLGMDFTNGTSGRYTVNGTAYNDFSSFLAATGGTFSRSSIGTYFDSTGALQTASANTPRFDYDPVTHQPKGIMIEESRTNLLTYSNMSATTGWAGSNTSLLTVNNPGSLPAGASACLRDEVNTGQAFGFVHQILTLSLNTTYTFSAWVYIPSTVPAGKAALTAWYNNAGWLTISSNFITERDQWVRKTHTFTTNATYPTTIIGAGLSNASPGLQSYVCLAQLEQGAFATSYIPTTTAAVTRARDILSLPIASWFNPAQMTMNAEYRSGATNGYSTRIASLNEVTHQNTFQLANSGAGSLLSQKVIGGSILNNFGQPYVSNTDYKIAGAISSTTNSIATNGTLFSNPNFNIPSGMNRLEIGHENSGSLLNGTIKKLKYYPSAITDPQLQLMTQ